MKLGITIFLMLPLLSCGASVQEVQAGLYNAEISACVVQAEDFDSGALCIKAVRAAHCGPSGVWADAGPGVCKKDGGQQ
jgi:hypothetical protein